MQQPSTPESTIEYTLESNHTLYPNEQPHFLPPEFTIECTLECNPRLGSWATKYFVEIQITLSTHRIHHRICHRMQSWFRTAAWQVHGYLHVYCMHGLIGWKAGTTRPAEAAGHAPSNCPSWCFPRTVWAFARPQRMQLSSCLQLDTLGTVASAGHLVTLWVAVGLCGPWLAASFRRTPAHCIYIPAYSHLSLQCHASPCVHLYCSLHVL